MNVESLQNYVIETLEENLDPRLTYHNAAHTIDVMTSAMRLADMENVNGHDRELLKTAALVHDMGMLRTYRDHEDESIAIAREILPGFGYNDEQLEKITKMILATRIPQSATNILEEILCDADLDYLGRDDYHILSLSLKYEWDLMEINPTSLREWYQVQVDFLSSHKYFTASAKKLRQSKKIEYLDQIVEICQFKK
jgi:HD superfamily phosphodiesterase